MAKRTKYVYPEDWPVEKLKSEIDKEFDIWDDIFKNGCADPNWEDGINLNLTRNHISFYYKILKGKIDEPVQMNFFAEEDTGIEGYREVPPEVPNNYMAPRQRHPERVERFKREGRI